MTRPLLSQECKDDLRAQFKALKQRRKAIELLIFEGMYPEALLLGHTIAVEIGKYFATIQGTAVANDLASLQHNLNHGTLVTSNNFKILVHALNDQKSFATSVRDHAIFSEIFSDLTAQTQSATSNKLHTEIVRPRSHRKRFSRNFILTSSLILLSVFAGYKYLNYRQLQNARINFIKTSGGKRVSDLMNLRDAIMAFHSKYGSYPKSEGFDGLYSCWGQSTKNWIPGLVPEFISALPRDPRDSVKCDQQYIYASNGVDFKLISHKPDNCRAVNQLFPEMIDPGRGCGTSAAYGFWSSGYKSI